MQDERHSNPFAYFFLVLPYATLTPLPFGYNALETIAAVAPAATKLSTSNYLDLMEAAFFLWLSPRYSDHWQVVIHEYHGFEGRVAFASGATAGAESNPTFLTYQEIVGQATNPLLPVINQSDRFSRFALPNGARISRKQLSLEGRQWSIRTPNITFKIMFGFNAGGDVRAFSTRFTDKIVAATDDADLQIALLQVSFTITPNSLKRWSGRTAEEVKWASELAESFRRDFDWRATNLQ